MRIGILLAALLTVVTVAFAQTKREIGLAKVDSVLQARRQRPTVYDTAYIVRPDSKLTLKVRANVSGNAIHAKGTVNDIYSRANLHTKNKVTMSFAAIYRGIALGFALNPAKMLGHNKDYELNLNIYSTRLSLDASYQSSKTLTGEIHRNGTFHVEKGYAKMNVLNMALYYTFNYKHFSYPAAFNQSQIQKRSAGSLLAGLSYQGGKISTNKDAPVELPDLSINAQHFGVGVGYGYNLVLGEKWLLHFSALPTFVVLNYNKLIINGVSKNAERMRLNVLLNERVALVRNFTERYFASMTLVMNNSIFDDDMVVVNQNKWRARASFGIRF